ncbi:MAG: hypothetical protein D6690_05835 [Nitrospirae bacterium]|nr:MAG: hypothetical protein D6690_05835 [Nitrospirota bacterium]
MTRSPCLEVRSAGWPVRHLVQLGLVLVLLQGIGCGSLAPTKDPAALQTAIDLKNEALALIEKATDPPAAHLGEIQALRQKLAAALEEEKQRSGPDAVSVKQWELLADPNGNLLGGFLTKWETEGTGRSPEFLAGVKQLVGQAFDQIIKLQRS